MSQYYNEDLCEGETKTGIISKIIVPTDRPLRKVWVFYQPPSAGVVAGSFCDLVFSLAGREVERFPAFRKTPGGTMYGLVTNIMSQNNLPTWPANSTPLNSRTPPPFGMSMVGDWHPGGEDNTALITPFETPMDCDLIQLITNNPPVVTWAMLACYSLPIFRA